MKFGKAIDTLKRGGRVARKGWAAGVYLYVIPGHLKVNPCIAMHTATGEEQPGWNASQSDIFAEDWLELGADEVEKPKRRRAPRAEAASA